jgi:tetratricopeptide (TPR) repeat protein
MKKVLARMFHEWPSRGRGGACATGQPQGVGSEAYLNSTSQGPTPEDARKDGHIHGRSRRIREISGLLVLVVYILISACPAWAQDATHFFNLGLESSMVNKKIHYFTKALELDPRLAIAYDKRGRLYYFQENYDKMMHDFYKFTDLSPSDPEGYRMLGLAHLKTGNLDVAIAKFSRAVELEQKLASAYGYRAEAYNRKGLPEKAVQDATKAIEIGTSQPTIGRAYTVRSKAYRQLGQEALAAADFDKAYDLDPENYGYKYFTITNHLASFTNDSSYISPGDMRRLGLFGVIAVLAALIFKLVLPTPRK